MHEYKIVERKMAHLFYLGKLYLSLMVELPYGPQGDRHDFRGEKKSEQTLLFKKFIVP